MPTPSASDNQTIIIEPSSGILRATWARPLLTAGLIDSYYQLLEVAAQANCRFWHLDLRQRIWPAATFMHWLMETYAPLATQRLGGPVYAAGWVSAKHQPHIEDGLTATMQHRVAEVGFHSAFFAKEPEARAWLLQQQAAEAAKQKQ